MHTFLAKSVDVRPNEISRALARLRFSFPDPDRLLHPAADPGQHRRAATWKRCPGCLLRLLSRCSVANVVFAATVARMSRRKFIPLAYGFFIFNLALFFLPMRSRPAAEQVWIGRGLFVWVSVFNLFNTAIFWAFMTDLFTVEQGKRLYGFIAVGGSLGAILGAYITEALRRSDWSGQSVSSSRPHVRHGRFSVRFFRVASLKQPTTDPPHPKSRSADRSGRALLTFATRLI